MGQSTDGHISHGILIEEDTKVPWDSERNGDIKEWWSKECGYKEPFVLFGPDGNYDPSVELKTVRNGIWEEKKPADETLVGKYFEHRREWDKRHPLPIELVNTCSGEYPIWIIAVPGTVRRAYRGSPVEIDPDEFHWNDHAFAAFLEFCEKYGIVGDGPKWWLGSYWG